jgi:hypothetical protein
MTHAPTCNLIPFNGSVAAPIGKPCLRGFCAAFGQWVNHRHRVLAKASAAGATGRASEAWAYDARGLILLRKDFAKGLWIDLRV